MPRVEEIFPPPNMALAMEPEELAGFVLEYLQELPRNDPYLNFHTLTLVTGPLGGYAGAHFQQVSEAIAAAWVWLMREGLIAPEPGTLQTSRVFVTRRGQRFKAHGDLEAYRRAVLLHEEALDWLLAQKVVPAFRRGDYDIAVFSAFKEVEVRVREVGGYSHGEIGVSLMRKAFHPETGPLTNRAAEGGERDAMMALFSGTIGVFKSPGSHRHVEFNAGEAAALIHFASYLLLIVETRREW